MKSLTTLIIAAAMTLGVAPHALAQDVADDPEALETLAEQIDIMKLVLTNALNTSYARLLEQKTPPLDENDEEDPDDEPDRRESRNEEPLLGDDVTTYRSALFALEQATDPSLTTVYRRTAFTSHTRGFYAQEIGVLFSGEVQTPVRPTVSAEPEDEPDEWDAAADQVRGNTTPLSIREQLISDEYALVRNAGVAEAWEIDSDFVDGAITSVLATIGKYGHKLEALPDNERIVVALRLSPGGAIHGRSSLSKNLTTLNTLFRTSGQMAGSAREVHLVIDVQKRELDRVKGQSTSEIVRELRGEARITSY
jgi:hypothetical protein